MPLLLLLLVVLMSSCSWVGGVQISLAGCQDECGGVKIPFPFGIGEGCFLPLTGDDPRDTYSITCDNTTNSKPQSPFLGNRTVLDINLQDHSLRVTSGAAYDCQFTGESVPPTMSPSIYTVVDDYRFSIILSSSRNKFVTIGCDTTAFLRDYNGPSIATCKTSCSYIDATNDPVHGCCEAPIIRNMSSPSIVVAHHDQDPDHPCSYAFVGEVGSYNFSSTSLTATAVDCFDFRVSLVYDWFLSSNAYDNCFMAKADEFRKLKLMCGSNSMFECDQSFEPDTWDLSITCQCLKGYTGNPYLSNGCQDIDECRDGRLNNCEKQEYCVNKKGGHECICPMGYLGNATTVSPCIPPSTHGEGKLIIGFSIAMGSMISFIILYGMLKLIKRRKEMKQRQHNFKRNGGLLLQQEMTTNEGVVDKTKIFTRNELVKATDNFNDNRVLGCGGQGTVYKGMLEDGTIVAVKKSKKVDEDQLAQFINEVVILSQINHRNIVRIFGCCLETDIPLLVYEFVHNGTLYQHIHHPTEDFEMTWEARLQIAVECAGAVAYLHSSCSSPIYHRDIKSSNILLDEKYKAKISDFGTSRSISIDKTHVTTCVQGTFGYLDPEFFRSSQFSAKSDVYSFGVVLLELLTSKKSIFTSTLGEPRGLANEFTQIMETSPNQFHGILDNQVLQHCSEEDIEALAKLIEQCLSMNLKQRPTMAEVAMALAMIKKSQSDREGNLLNEQEIRMQVEEDDSDGTNEDTFVNNSADDSSYSMDLHP